MTVRKLPGSNKYRLYSAAGKNLGTFPTRAAALRHEREVQYFKHAGDGAEEAAITVSSMPLLQVSDADRKALRALTRGVHGEMLAHLDQTPSSPPMRLKEDVAIIARRSRIIVGWSLINTVVYHPDEVEIHTFVRPEDRGKGVGTRLVAKVNEVLGGREVHAYPRDVASKKLYGKIRNVRLEERVDSGDATTRGKQLYIPGVPHSTRLPPVLFPPGSKWKKGDSRIPTAPSIVPPQTVEKTSIEYFAASFIAGVEHEDADAWEEYEGDPRTSLIAAAVRKLGVQRIQRVLGSGSFGTAALDEEGHVVKLTSDETEAHAGAVIKGKDLPHVVWVAGAWFVGGVEVSPGWMRGEQDEGPTTRVGVLSMEKVEPIDRFSREAHELNTIVHKVKRNEDAYPDAIFAMNPGEARHHLLHVSEVLEGELRARGGFDGDLLHDIAAALHELREHGVYAVDVHSGNVGLDEESGVHKVYDIGTSSSPARPKPPVVRGKGSKRKSTPRRQAREDYILAYEVPVPELTRL